MHFLITYISCFIIHSKLYNEIITKRYSKLQPQHLQTKPAASYLSFPPRMSRTPPRAPSHSPCSWSLFRTPLWWGFPTYMARTCLMFFLILSHVFLRMHDVRLFHVIHRLHIMFSTYPTHIWLTHHTHFYISIISNVLRLVYSC